MLHVNSDASLAQDHQLAVERIDQRIGRHPGERRRRRIFEVALAGAAEEQEFSAGPQERLKRIERSISIRTARIETRSSASWSSARGSSSSNRDVSTSASRRPEGSNRFPQEHGLARLDFDHPQREVAAGELERDGRRAAAGAGIEQRPRVLRDVSRGDHRFDQQPIDRLVFALGRRAGRP